MFLADYKMECDKVSSGEFWEAQRGQVRQNPPVLAQPLLNPVPGGSGRLWDKPPITATCCTFKTCQHRWNNRKIK